MPHAVQRRREPQKGHGVAVPVESTGAAPPASAHFAAFAVAPEFVGLPRRIRSSETMRALSWRRKEEDIRYSTRTGTSQMS